jgi:excisionase family DNA binding protein
MALSVAEAAVEARIGRDGIYAAIREGRLSAVKWGRRTLITDEALQRFLNGLPPKQPMTQAKKSPAADCVPPGRVDVRRLYVTAFRFHFNRGRAVIHILTDGGGYARLRPFR